MKIMTIINVLPFNQKIYLSSNLRINKI